MEAKKEKERIQVCVRIRPLSYTDTGTGSIQIISRDPPVLSVVDRPQSFQLDKIFTQDATQQQIYDEAVKPQVQQILNGVSSTVFAYGQTGTGKTYTMGTNAFSDEYDAGIIPRALVQLFDEKEVVNAEEEIEISLSYLEIYREKAYDLFDQSNFPLTVTGFTVQNLKKLLVKDVHEAKRLLEMGNKKRHVGETKQNINSSRSHAIFTIHYTCTKSVSRTEGKLNLVDLAGSESLKKTHSQGSTFQEGININKGLLYIGQVISAISNRAAHIPYRQSMITTILKASLSGENYISLIACISARLEDVTETFQTLDFAQQTKKIKRHPTFLNTPTKRPLFTPMKTVPKLRPVNESQLTDFSTNSVDITQQALSPLLRKHMNALEERLLSRLSSVAERRVTRASMSSMDKENATPNTPDRKLIEVKRELTQEKSDIAQLIDQSHIMKSMATSSPITRDISGVKRLSYGTNPKNTPNNKKMSISPIATVIPPKTPRRSLRLGTNPKNTPNNKKKSISPIAAVIPPKTPRRSLRLSLKPQKSLSDRNMNERLDLRKSRRRSRFGCCCEFNDNIPGEKKLVNRKMPKIKGALMVSPFTAHKRNVLQTLNYGTGKEIEKLYTIGPKTSEQILTYRQINGRFDAIEDVARMPGWTGKKFDKFINSNMLQKL